MQIGTNHFGHFYLTQLLLPKMKATVRLLHAVLLQCCLACRLWACQATARLPACLHSCRAPPLSRSSSHKLSLHASAVNPLRPPCTWLPPSALLPLPSPAHLPALRTHCLAAALAPASQGGPGRIVAVASTAHKMGKLDVEDLNWERRKYSAWGRCGRLRGAPLCFGAGWWAC